MAISMATIRPDVTAVQQVKLALNIIGAIFQLVFSVTVLGLALVSAISQWMTDGASPTLVAGSIAFAAGSAILFVANKKTLVSLKHQAS